jgi:hypothetical protein
MGDTYDTGEAAADRIQQPTLRIEVQVVRYGGRGPVYRVLQAGQVLLAHSRCRLFEACRALLAQGSTGRLELWRPGEATFNVATLSLGRGTRSLKARPEVSSWRPGHHGMPFAVPRSSLGRRRTFRRCLSYPGANAEF